MVPIDPNGNIDFENIAKTRTVHGRMNAAATIRKIAETEGNKYFIIDKNKFSEVVSYQHDTNRREVTPTFEKLIDVSLLSPKSSVKPEDMKSKRSDAEYMQTVENGDMEAAQRMVDEAAKKAGYTIKVFHLNDPPKMVRHSIKGKKKSDEKQLAKLALITAILALISQIAELATKAIEMLNKQ